MELETALDVDLVALATGGEVAVLLNLAAPAARKSRVRDVSLAIRPADAVPAFTLWNDLPVCGRGEDVVVELGDFHAGAQRGIVVGFELPVIAELGAADVCELAVRWVDDRARGGWGGTVRVVDNLIGERAAAFDAHLDEVARARIAAASGGRPAPIIDRAR